jgi:hypothetical protein
LGSRKTWPGPSHCPEEKPRNIRRGKLAKGRNGVKVNLLEAKEGKVKIF